MPPPGGVQRVEALRRQGGGALRQWDRVESFRPVHAALVFDKAVEGGDAKLRFAEHKGHDAIGFFDAFGGGKAVVPIGDIEGGEFGGEALELDGLCRIQHPELVNGAIGGGKFGFRALGCDRIQ